MIDMAFHALEYMEISSDNCKERTEEAILELLLGMLVKYCIHAITHYLPQSFENPRWLQV